MLEMEDRQQRVKARWAILRRALLESSSKRSSMTDNTREGNDYYSMNSFSGFGVLKRIMADDQAKYQSYTKDEDGEWYVIQNSYTVDNKTIQFYTREVKKQSPKLKRDALLSHRNYGVDNTGNVRVWDAESTLAGFLLDVLMNDGACTVVEHAVDTSLESRADQVLHLSSLWNTLRSKLLRDTNKENTVCNILELGAGQAGLAGLALVTASSENGHDEKMMKKLHITLSDGHPNCIKNNAICVQMMKKDNVNNPSIIDTKLLLWDSSQKGNESCRQLQETIDICLASDCVHFQEYHDGLFMTIGRTVSVNGVALLCQPRRGKSLENFMSLVNFVNSENEKPLFEMILLEDFHAKVSQQHNCLLNKKGTTVSSYNPDWHRPLLLYLKKIRRYNEEIDGSLARKHVQSYNSIKEKNDTKENNRLAPYNPTHSTAQMKALEMLDLQTNDVLFDLGCGDGRFLVVALEAALDREIRLKCVGIEYDQALSQTAKQNLQKVQTSSEQAFIRWDDVLNEKGRGNTPTLASNIEELTLLNDATAVFVYLLPDGLKKIRPILMEAAKRRRHQKEINQSTLSFRVVSYMFSIPGWKPTIVDTSSKGGCALHYYEDIDLFDLKALQ